MYRKLLLSGILVFCSIANSNFTFLQKSKITSPSFDFTKSDHQYPKRNTSSVPFWETKENNNPIDTSALKQSNWYADAIKNIEASEYEISKDDKTGMFTAPNRQQQLRAFYNYNSFTLQPRAAEQDWVLKMQVTGIFAGKKLIAQPAEKDLSVRTSNKIVFSNDIFSTEYINSKEGVRQNFIIQKEPAGKPQTINIKLQTGKGWYINKVHDKELHFAKRQGKQLSKKIIYNSLKVWDVNNKELTARFVVNKKHTAFEIEVTATGAVYPITIDPISTTPTIILNGISAGDDFGVSVASASDVNGDGYSDVIVGAVGVSSGTGAAYVFLGSSSGLSASPATTLNGISAGDAFGGVASAGDVNGDGYSDVIVSAIFVSGSKGAAYVFLGSSTGLSASPTTILNGVNPDDFFGVSVACAGDVNGDGYSDVIIGADEESIGEGVTYVFLGTSTGLSVSPTTTLNGISIGDRFGSSVASTGDINGDGYSDIIVGAWVVNSSKGAAYVYHGSPNGLSATQTRILSPDNQSLANIGWVVASAGDVNADGYSDVIVGAPGYDDGANADEGRAWVYYGHTTGLSATPDVILDDANQADANFGYSVASAGDVNGDGFCDVVVGAFLYDDPGNTNEGRVWVYYGSAAGLSAIPARILDDANQDGAWFGNSVASAGDVNGDGYGDVIIGARNYAGSGAAFVYYGHNTTGLSISPDRILTGENQAGAQFGVYVASAGDVNGDGYSDVVIGAWQYDGSFGANEGRAYVYNGSGTGLSATQDRILSDGNQAGCGFGARVAGVGDVNADGFADVLVVAIFYDGGKGRGWVYYGHAGTGLSPTPDVILDNTAGGGADQMGYGASGAGDINGDGYSDVIVGLPQHLVSFPEDGQAYIYYGSSAGLSATPGLIIHDATEAEEFFGSSVAGAGDINGDGYSDVIVGAPHGSYPTSFGGRAYVHNGNDSITNKRNNLRLYNSDLSTPINSSNFIFGNFGAGLFAKSFLGRDKGKLVWETRLNYNAYSGTPITNSTFFTAQQSSYTDLGLAGVELKNLIDKLLGSGRYTKLRARIKYDPVTAITGQVYGPWRNVSSIIDGNSLGALPFVLISFKAAWLQKGKTAKINFTTDKETGICCFDIEKSMDGFNFTAIGKVVAKNTSGIQSYSFIDNTATGKNLFYRLKIKGVSGKVEYSNIQQLQNNTTTEILVFPNPTTDVLQLQLNGDYNKMNVQVVNSAGQIVIQLNNLAVLSHTLTIPVKNLAAGNYWLRLQSGATMQVLQFVKQ